MASDNGGGFCVPYTIRDTPDKGRGVFAEAPIRKGTIVWRYVRGHYAVYDERMLEERLAKLSRSEVVHELEHMFGASEFPGYVIRVFDDGVLINHSREPNIVVNNRSGDAPYESSARCARDVEDALLDDRFGLITTRDLAAGEELMHDYDLEVEDPPYYDALCEKYEVKFDFL